ncbi:MAG: DUF1353 domain-containing protein [Verrucomicrobiota bacterium JB022]|nr:DUF1353 domain-containing protein [Verrucomicrobiota bacterium JB022]
MSNNDELNFGRYTGRLILEPLSDGRRMRVVEDFGFHDVDDAAWPVPIGAKVDGASIPRALWSVIGGPFAGKYRAASVVHDFYCDVRSKPWKSVHRVFYNAMRASGVSEPQAKLMYAAVYFAGPRWPETVVDNVGLLRRSKRRGGQKVFRPQVSDAMEADEMLGSFDLEEPETEILSTKAVSLDLEALQALIQRNAPSLADIDEAIDKATDLPRPDAVHLQERILTVKSGRAPEE